MKVNKKNFIRHFAQGGYDFEKCHICGKYGDSGKNYHEIGCPVGQLKPDEEYLEVSVPKKALTYHI